MKNCNHERVIFNLATMPSRVNSLQETIESVIQQADEINVYLNDYKSIPEFLYHHKINYFKSQDELGDLGDAGKFFKVSTQKGYIFTIDDDLIYPRTYAADMIRQIERFNRRVVITCHGRIFPDRKITTIYRDALEFFGCLERTREAFIHCPGTGVSAFHSDTILPPLSLFKASNMADVWLSIYLQKKEIPILCMAHPKSYIRESDKYDRNYTIFNFCHSLDAFQTQQINKIKNWKIHTCEDTMHHTSPQRSTIHRLNHQSNQAAIV